MNQQLMLERIAMLFSRFSESVNILNANGEFSINTHAENALIRVLNTAFECDFENVNYSENNRHYPSIDLADRKKRIAIQITANESLNKVKDCLTKFVAHGLDKEFDKLYILMLVRKQGSYSSRAIDSVKGGFNFSVNDIIEIKDIYLLINQINDIDIIRQLLAYLECQFGDATDDGKLRDYYADIKEYDESILRQYRYIDLSGLSPRIKNFQVKIELRDVYIDTQIKLYQEEMDSKPNNATVPLSQILISSNKSVILGGPGSGKSTLLKWIMYDICSKRELYNLDIPVYIKCSSYARYIQSSPTDLGNYLFSNLNLKSKKIVQEAIISGNIILLIDGYDEISDISLKHEVKSNIEEFCSFNPTCRVIVTSRKAGYAETRLGMDFEHYELAKFDLVQIEEFINRWYYHIDEEPDENAICSFMDILQSNPSVLDLASTPLLLMILCLVQYRSGVLPENRVELYDIATDTLLDNWVKKRNLSNKKKSYTVREIKYLLWPVAMYMQEFCDEGVISETAFKEKVLETYSKVWGFSYDELEAEERVEEIIEYVKSDAGFIRENGVDERGVAQFSFIHLTFQEYFAAIGIAAKWQRNQISVEQIKEYVLSPYWTEVMKLATEILYFTAIDFESARMYCTSFLKSIFEVDDVLDNRNRPLQIVTQALMSSTIVEEDVLGKIVITLIDKQYLGILVRLIKKSKQKRYIVAKLIDEYDKAAKRQLIADIFMRTSEEEYVKRFVIDTMRGKDYSRKEPFFECNTIFTWDENSLLSTKEFQDSIVNYVNDRLIDSELPIQYFESLIPQYFPPKTAISNDVKNAIMLIENHELRQYALNQAFTSNLWKDSSDKSDFIKLIKDCDRTLDFSVFEQKLKEEEIERDISMKLSQAIHLICDETIGARINAYYSIEDNQIFIKIGRELHSSIANKENLNNIPFPGRYNDDREGFIDFILIIINYCVNKHIVLDTDKQKVTFLKYWNSSSSWLCNELRDVYSNLFEKIELTISNINTYLMLFREESYWSYFLRYDENVIDFVLEQSFSDEDKLLILSRCLIKKKQRKKVKIFVEHYLNSHTDIYNAMDNDFEAYIKGQKIRIAVSRLSNQI